MKQVITGLVLAVAASGAALAQGCPPEGGAAVPEIQAMNQLLLDRRFEEFAGQVQAMANMNIDGPMQAVGEAFADGLDDCATLLQRRDIGGLTQELVMYRSSVGPLFLYWMYAATGDGFTLLQFKLDSGLDLLENLR